MNRFDMPATIFTYRKDEKQSCLVTLNVPQKKYTIDIILISE